MSNYGKLESQRGGGKKHQKRAGDKAVYKTVETRISGRGR